MNASERQGEYAKTTSSSRLIPGRVEVGKCRDVGIILLAWGKG